MATSLKNKIKNPVLISMIIILLSITISIGIGRIEIINQWVEKEYFGSSTFIETLADLTGYLKQTVVEEKDLYYPQYEELDNLIYYISANNGTKTFTNSEDSIVPKVLEGNSKFYMRLSFKEAYNYSIQSSNNDAGYTNNCFRKEFKRIIDQGAGHRNIQQLGYSNLEVYYFVKEGQVKQTDFIYTNLQRYKFLSGIKIAIAVQAILTLGFMIYILVAAYKDKIKGKGWEVLKHAHIEVKIIGLIISYIGMDGVYWQIRWYSTSGQMSGDGSIAKLYLGSLYIVGSILLTTIMAWYLVDISYIWRNGRWQQIKESSLIIKHKKEIKKGIGNALGLVYSLIGINIENPSYGKLAILNGIHIVALIVLARVAWSDEAYGILLAANYTGIACLGGIVLAWDFNKMLKKIRKIRDIQIMLTTYIKMLFRVLVYGGSLMLLAIVGYDSDILGILIALGIGATVAICNLFYVKKCRELYHYVVAIKEHKQPTRPPRSFLSPIIDELASIEESFQNAVSQEVISQRMKTELISNVSHDLKTPLTSIINYVDLLKNEDLTKEVQQEYIQILDRKSQRLKVLIEDLFEASKAASGNVELVTEKIDVIALMKQTLGELAEKISTSTLQFKMNMPEEKVFCELDGRRTYRIFENLMGNILKYSAPNSRVYIECIVDEEVHIIFKNMSAYEMNFSPEEITERFKRGDESRHTEGSGLGLAIAKNLVELQGGTLEIIIDGDLFKVIVKFKRAT